MPRRGSAPPFSPCPLLPALRISALRACAARAHIVCPLRPTVRRHLASGSALARHHRTLVRHACVPDAPSHRLPMPTHRATHRHPTPTHPSPVASPLRSRPLPRAFASSPLPIASSACRVRPCVAISRQVRRLRAITGRSSGTRAFPMRHAIVSPCRPIVPCIGIHRRRTRRHLRRAFGPDASRMRLPMVAPAARRAFASSTRVDRPRATTHALSSATRLGPDRLHTCHMSLSTAEPLWFSHLTHRWCMPYFVLSQTTLTTLEHAVLRLFVINRIPDMPGIVRPFWVT